MIDTTYLKQKILDNYSSIEHFSICNGYHPSTVYRWISGETKLKIAVILDLEEQLNLDITKLIKRIGS